MRPDVDTDHDGRMKARGRLTAAGAVALGAASALSSCSSSPTAHEAADTTTTTAASTSTSTSTTVGTTTRPGVAVPNVIGLRITAARAALHAVGLPTVSLNLPCNRGTLASQSVVSSLSIPGTPPNPSLGAVPLSPGADVPPGTRVGITWSACYGNGSAVPAVVGLTFAAARHALHVAGLTWACYSVGKPTTTTMVPSSSTTTTAKPAPTVLTQDPVAGTVLRPGATVRITMHACPQ